ncbi:signal peptidase II [Chloroflexota bacterium]
MVRTCRWGSWQDAIFLGVAVLVLVLDQASKAWIKSNVPLGGAVYDLGFFRIGHYLNTGAAFGMFRDQTLVLTIVSVVGALAILYFVLNSRRFLPFMSTGWGKVVLGLVLGGTLGNLVDRLWYSSVTDFIDFSFFPSFNVADSAISVGAVLVAIYFLRHFSPQKV